MTNDQIRRKIAEACGYRNIHAGTPIGLWGELFPTRGITEIPNYPESHDTMAEALGTLSKLERSNFVLELTHIHATGFTFDLINSTPLQKAEAFLRAKGLWEGKE